MSARLSAVVYLVDPRPRDAAWPAAVWPPPPGTVLCGGVVELREADPAADAEELFAVLDRGEVWAHVAGRPPSAAALFDVLAARRADPAWVPWTVRLQVPVGPLPAGAIVGTTSYLDVSAADARAEIGSTAYAPAVWGSRVNPDAKLLLLTYAFEQARLGRVQLKTDIRNTRSQRAIERMGAAFEGVLRRYQRRADGSVRDTVLYSVTAEDWPYVRELLMARLGESEPGITRKHAGRGGA